MENCNLSFDENVMEDNRLYMTIFQFIISLYIYIFLPAIAIL